MNQQPRDWSVYPVWLTGAPRFEYAKVRADEGALGVGRRVSVQRNGETAWRVGRVVEPRTDVSGVGGGTVWIELR